MVTPSSIALGRGSRAISLLLKAKPSARGVLVFRQNGKELLRKAISGNADRFTHIRDFTIACLEQALHWK